MKKDRVLVAQAQPHGAVAPKFEEADASAMQSLRDGTANEGQQQRALDWILKSACGLSIWPYKENQRETDIALGRQFVGHQIVALLSAKTAYFNEGLK